MSNVTSEDKSMKVGEHDTLSSVRMYPKISLQIQTMGLTEFRFHVEQTTFKLLLKTFCEP